MISSNPNRLFGPGGCLTPLAIRNYVDGSLRKRGRMQVEEHVKNCRLCAEALEGFKRHGRSAYSKSDLAFLSRRIRQKYSGRSYQPDKRLSMPILISLAVFLILLLGIFYILRQDITSRSKGPELVRDSLGKVVNVLPDSSGLNPEIATGDSNRIGK